MFIKASSTKIQVKHLATCLGFQYLPRLAHGIKIKGDHILTGPLKWSKGFQLSYAHHFLLIEMHRVFYFCLSSKTFAKIVLVSTSLKPDIYIKSLKPLKMKKNVSRSVLASRLIVALELSGLSLINWRQKELVIQLLTGLNRPAPGQRLWMYSCFLSLNAIFIRF